MISNTNVSASGNGEIVNIPRYIGVGSLHVLAVNPSNKVLKQYGWNIGDDAPEPEYVRSITFDNGETRNYLRLNLLCSIEDKEDVPVVSLNFKLYPEVMLNKDGTKCKIIDKYGRTAWVTKEEMREKKIPMYATGAANIDPDYQPCHRGEEELIQFLLKYLKITPVEFYNSDTGRYQKNSNPGYCTIDNWARLCSGDVTEIRQAISMQPENCVKVILGIGTTDDNKTYQTFINNYYIANGARPSNGAYPAAKRAIDKYLEGGYHENETFSDEPVKVYVEKPTEEIKPANSDDKEIEKIFADPIADDLPFKD